MNFVRDKVYKYKIELPHGFAVPLGLMIAGTCIYKGPAPISTLAGKQYDTCFVIVNGKDWIFWCRWLSDISTATLDVIREYMVKAGNKRAVFQIAKATGLEERVVEGAMRHLVVKTGEVEVVSLGPPKLYSLKGQNEKSLIKEVPKNFGAGL